MRKLIFFMHTSLDGFVAGPNGEMDWINLDDALFDFVGTMTDQSDTALYGRVTYQLMEGYWPTAAEQPDASKHDIEHGNWYNNVAKVVLSTTIDETGLTNTTVISNQLADNINKLKQQEGKNILIFGSPGASQSLLNLGLIDEFWLFVNPIILGQGLSLFNHITGTTNLKLLETRSFDCGVLALHYEKQ
ncbi:dihydrofolate reductase [Spirosoma sp. HMF4905]|uniref:Dihydrofolate reductase n=1 Tax=Spirosoma arboris TaxID=2682092 RepID=A0A7K1SP82_9BACT|nr:dihydrofolate reductase family protein [Spirosoma arboris]MVM35386.1 dihydrofolate reductase [Spirosoma arboris]